MATQPTTALTPELLDWLQSAAGQAVLAQLAAEPLNEANLLQTITRLRRHLPAEQARAAVDQIWLRKLAKAKFRFADRMFFTREGLEQSSGDALATWRAARFQDCEELSDICCGIGGDALAFAGAGLHVTAIDRDALRLAIVQANAAALGLENRVQTECRDIIERPPETSGTLFCDPGRRSEGKRRLDIEQYEPPLSTVFGWHRAGQRMAIKIAPGADVDELVRQNKATREFISIDGALKEQVIWFDTPLEGAIQASILTSHTPDNLLSPQVEGKTDFTTTILVHQPNGPQPPLAEPEGWLYEPDLAVIRAGLVAECAAVLGAAQIDREIAYLTAPRYTATRLARAWKIIAWQPFQLKRLRAALRDLDAGEVTVKKRGSPLETDQLARQLRGDGTRSIVVVLTFINNAPAAILCDPPRQRYDTS